MQSLHFGPNKKPVNPLLPKRVKLQPLNDQSLVVEPAPGPRLALEPIFGFLFIAPPEDNNPTPGMEGGIHLPENAAPRMPGYAVCEVLQAGPDVMQVKKGDRVAFCVVHAEKFVIDRNVYWRLSETAVLGVIRQ